MANQFQGMKSMPSFLSHISSRDADDNGTDASRRRQLREISEILFNAEAEMRRCNSMSSDKKNGSPSRAVVTKLLEAVARNLWEVYETFFALLELDFDSHKNKLGIAVPLHLSKVPPFFRQAVINNEYRISNILSTINKFVSENIYEWDQVPLPDGVEVLDIYARVDRSKVRNMPLPSLRSSELNSNTSADSMSL